MTSLATGREHRLGPLEEIPLGEGRAYSVGDLQIAVFRPRDGSLHATQALCPHAAGPLADGQLDGCVVICPLHAATFELDTGSSPSGHPALAVHPVRVVDGVVVVTVDAPGS